MGINQYFKIVYRFIKRHIKGFIVAYIILFFPCAYLMTSATTQLKVSEYDKTFMSTIDSGVINIASGGFYKPALNGSHFIIGKIKSSMGDSFRIKSQNHLVKSKSWSELGQENNQERSNTFIFKTLRQLNIISNDEELEVQSSPQRFNYFDYPDYVLDLGLADLDFKSFDDKPKFSKNSIKVKLSYQSVKKNQSNQLETNNKIDKDINNEEVIIPKRGNQHETTFMYHQVYLLSPEFGVANKKDNLEIVTLPFIKGQDGHGGITKVNNDVKKYLSQNKNQHVAYEIQAHRSKQNDKLIDYAIIKVMSENKQLNQTYQVFNEARGWDINRSNGHFKIKE